ncbi:hypothetical protein [Actinokineospora sp.]|uniref:hypothetical protein n=1 Tax=Actinokineospora sp. TaxID=1872133 RepID=UPI004037EAC0
MPATGRTDDELADASRETQDAIYMMVEETGMDHSHGGRAADARLDHLNAIASLSPQKISDEHTRMYDAALAISSSEKARAELAETNKHLNAWTGDAADEFTKQLSRIDTVLDTLGTTVWKTVDSAAAFFALSYHCRESLYNLCKETTAAALREIEDQNKRETKVAIALGSEIIDKLLSIDPSKAVRDGLGLLVKATGITTDYLIDDGNGDTIIDSYLHAGNALQHSYEDGLEIIKTKIWEIEDSLVASLRKADVFKPMASCVYIDSPDFSYDKFITKAYPSETFTPMVEDQRKPYIDEQRAEDSEIRRRLGGAS